MILLGKLTAAYTRGSDSYREGRVYNDREKKKESRRERKVFER